MFLDEPRGHHSEPVRYEEMPVAAQYALVSAEAHHHLPRLQEAARMWRVAGERLRELSDSLRRELDLLAPHWNDTTGTGFVAQVERRKAAVDDALARVEAHQPWRALDDLARQLVLTRARLAEAVEGAVLTQALAAGHAHHADGGEVAAASGDLDRHGAAHLVELDRYFEAAATAVRRGCGAEEHLPPVAVTRLDHQHDHGGQAPAGTFAADAAPCCAEPAGPRLAGLPGAAPALLAGPVPGGGALPPGSVSLPGLIAIPPSGLGNSRPRGAGAPRKPGASAKGGPGPLGSHGGGAPTPGPAAGAGGPSGPTQIAQAARPVVDGGPPPAPEAPRLPGQASAASAAQPSTGGRFFPPMMMPPMLAGAGGAAAGRGTGAARATGGEERRTRPAQGTPGVPARLRGRATQAGAPGARPAPARRGTGPADAEVLDHELWQVAEAPAAAPLAPEPPAEQTRRTRRRAL